MTHILIRITELDEREADLRALREKATGGNMKAFYASAISEIMLIKSFGKEVSLTEEDIEVKATAFAKTGRVSGKFGYRQALKDLR